MRIEMMRDYLPQEGTNMSRSAQIAVGMVVAALVLSATAGAAFLLLRRNACTKEVLGITNVSNTRFVIERSDCDVLAKDEFISVYATKLPASPLWGTLGWFNRRSLLFRYDPGDDDHPLPSITVLGKEQIRIAVPKVSSIVVQNRTWNGESITYAVGSTYFPNVSK
jgi:hypothetical protein